MTAQAEMKKTNPLKRFTQTRGVGQVLTVTLGLIVLIIAFSLMNPQFSSAGNITNLIRQICPILLIGIGQAFVCITGNIDLSIGSVIGMSTMLAGTFMQNGMAAIPAMIITLAACLAVGVVNGLLVAKFKLPPFIATLGTMTIARGIAQIANGNYNTDSIKNAVGAQEFKDVFYYGEIIKGSGIYIIAIVTIVIWAIFNFYLSRTRSGRHIYAIGSNIEAAKLSGVNAVTTTIKAYLVSAFCASIVGFYTLAQAGMGAMDAGISYEMYAVAAAVIGGVSTLGGQGLLAGVIVGAAIWQVLRNGLQFANVSVSIQNIIVGVIVIASVLLDVVMRTGRGRKKVKEAVVSQDSDSESLPPKPDMNSQD